MALIKYVRVSSKTQNPERQLTDEKKYERVYMEVASGKNANRPKLKEMLAYVRQGDTVEVESFSRFARNTRDLLSIVEELQKKGVAFVSQKEQIDTGTPQGRFMLTVFAALAELERDSLLERQAEGIAIAKQQGRMGRPAIAITPNFITAYERWKAGELTAVKAMKEAGMSKSVFYRKVQEYEKSANKLASAPTLEAIGSIPDFV